MEKASNTDQVNNKNDWLTQFRTTLSNKLFLFETNKLFFFFLENVNLPSCKKQNNLPLPVVNQKLQQFDRQQKISSRNLRVRTFPFWKFAQESSISL